MHLIISFKIKTKTEKTARNNREGHNYSWHFNILFSMICRRIKSKVSKHIEGTNIIIKKVDLEDICKKFHLTFFSNTHKAKTNCVLKVHKQLLIILK